MDLSSIINKGDTPMARPPQLSSPDVSRNRPELLSTLTNQHPLPLSHRSSSGGIVSSHGHDVAHLSQGSVTIPTYIPPQSPAGSIGSQYQQFHSHSTPASLSRASSHTQPYAQSSPTHRYTPLPQQALSHARPSNSPTPSHHSPLSSIHPGQGLVYPLQPQYNPPQSQPATPLAPPFLSRSRPSMGEVHSPPHQRSVSGTSNSMLAGSPAQHSLSIGNLVESPIAQHRSQPQMRRASDQSTSHDRDRSVSVSPKTRIPPRPSFGSRDSGSQQELQSAHSSIHPASTSPAEMAPRQSQYPSASVNGHVVSSSSSQGDHATHIVMNSPSTHMQTAPRPQLDHVMSSTQLPHQSQKMGMDHLLTPTSEVPVAGNGTRIEIARPQPPQISLAQQPSLVTDSMIKQEQHRVHPSPRTPLKRAADSELVSEQPEFKRGKRRRHTDRPNWARLMPDNPIVRDPSLRVSSKQSHKVSHPMNGSQADDRTAPSPAAKQIPQTTVESLTGNSLDLPWTMNPPLDTDLIRTRQILGPWEKSIKWVTPYPGMVKAVQDWLFVQLSRLGDVGNDPDEGAVEIEAKIGHIISKQNDERLRMPLLTATVLDPSANDNIRFESQMDERAHSAMNKFLNATIQASMAPGRVKMHYEHPKETDSFRLLSQAGIQALPAAMRRHPVGRDLRLRTTKDNKTDKVTARIVKVNIADLHIYDPTGDYDCRISINLEVNLNRPDLAPFDHLTIEPSGEKPAPPDRKKDRLSYKHLAYSIDLTKVEVSNNLAAKHELELEVDARLLREQMHLLAAGRPDNAFGDIVSGFIDNATFLMRQRVGE